MEICGNSATQYGEPENCIVLFFYKSRVNNKFFENVSKFR
jgi:hypothetical protein